VNGLSEKLIISQLAEQLWRRRDAPERHHRAGGAAAANYVDAFMGNIRRDNVSRLPQQLAR
jgi:hypothetical protein